MRPCKGSSVVKGQQLIVARKLNWQRGGKDACTEEL